jgi:hypothetical protein
MILLPGLLLAVNGGEILPLIMDWSLYYGWFDFIIFFRIRRYCNSNYSTVFVMGAS